MADRRAQIEARLAAATPGTWTAQGSQVSGPDGSLVAAVREHTETEHRPDADLIAQAPADLRWLLDALAEAEAERDRWKARWKATVDDVSTAQAEIDRLYPCDGGCGYDGPEEECTRHGRSPAELWSMVRAVEAEVAAWERDDPAMTLPLGEVASRVREAITRGRLGQEAVRNEGADRD